MSKPANQKTEKKKDSLGRLKSLGLKALYQVPLYLPSAWDDLTQVVSTFDNTIPEGPCLVRGTLDGHPQTKFTNSGVPRTTGILLDEKGRKLRFSTFGDTRDMVDELVGYGGEPIFLLGQMTFFDKVNWMNTPEIVPERWVGRLRPRYAGKTGVIKPETVRERILMNLKEAIPEAGEFLSTSLQQFGSREQLAQIAGLPRWSLESILLQAHVPKNRQYGELAQAALERLAALGIIHGATASRGIRVCSKPLKLAHWSKRAKQISFQLTKDQEVAISEAIIDLSSSVPMRRMLSGDVGTGKTACIGTVCAVVVDAGGTAAVMLPNETLASQMAREFSEWWPDLPIQFVTGSTKNQAITGRLLVGTTALLFRDLPYPTLVVCDEQQKASREQREMLVGPETHLLEATATAIPRTQALVRYGMVKVSKLKECHAKKNIITRIWHRQEWNELYAAVKKTIEDGSQVILVYALKDKEEEKPKDETESKDNTEKNEAAPEKQKRPMNLRSATEVFEKWDQMFPGQVRLIHGDMSAEEKEQGIRDMREGKASIAFATTVVETGLNLPLLRRIVIVNPERHGLTTLHQLRGRVARLGGDGWCDLFLPSPVKEETMARLKVMEQTQDGFEIAEQDMRLRGIGDITEESVKQSGSDDTFLFGKAVSIEILDEMMELLEKEKR